MIEPQPYKDKVTQAEANVEAVNRNLHESILRTDAGSREDKAISEIDYLQAQSDYGEALAAKRRSQLSLANITSYCIVKAL
ncbi:MAG: hypothetical protein ACLTZT_13025 [Butyricimonas faecalis]